MKRLALVVAVLSIAACKTEETKVEGMDTAAATMAPAPAPMMSDSMKMMDSTMKMDPAMKMDSTMKHSMMDSTKKM